MMQEIDVRQQILEAASRHRGIAASRHRGIAASRHRGIGRGAASIFMSTMMFRVPVCMHTPPDAPEERPQAALALLREGLQA